MVYMLWAMGVVARGAAGEAVDAGAEEAAVEGAGGKKGGGGEVQTGELLGDIPDAPDEFENAPAVWDIQAVYSAAARELKGRIGCETAGCLLPACALWSSSDEEWNTCEACQEADFGVSSSHNPKRSARR
jgi:hypothetical protein